MLKKEGFGKKDYTPKNETSQKNVGVEDTLEKAHTCLQLCNNLIKFPLTTNIQSLKEFGNNSV